MNKIGEKELFARFEREEVTTESFKAIVEIPKGSKCKYEFDKVTGLIRLDRVLSTSTHYPHCYGFIPLTHCEDGDALDVLVLCSEMLAPMTIVECRPIGVLEMYDGGKVDPKIIAVAISDPNYNMYEDVRQLPQHVCDEIRHFFDVYKNLEHKRVLTGDIDDSTKAKQVLQHCIDLYEEKVED